MPRRVGFERIKYLLALLLSFSSIISFGQTLNNKYGKPLVVLTEANPWLMVIGSDSPSFALYENGQVIFKKRQGNKVKYFEVRKEKAELQNLMSNLGISVELAKLPQYINASNSTDQPTTTIYLNIDSLQEISLYGPISSKTSEARKEMPVAFLNAYDNIVNFNEESATEWLPEHIEILASAYGNSKEKPLAWKKEWNDIHSKTTIKRDEGLYSIYLDKKYFKDFIKLLNKLGQKQAVLINGKKYALSYRFPFPNIN